MNLPYYSTATISVTGCDVRLSVPCDCAVEGCVFCRFSARHCNVSYCCTPFKRVPVCAHLLEHDFPAFTCLKLKTLDKGHRFVVVVIKSFKCVSFRYADHICFR